MRAIYFYVVFRNESQNRSSCMPTLREWARRVRPHPENCRRHGEYERVNTTGNEREYQIEKMKAGQPRTREEIYLRGYWSEENDEYSATTNIPYTKKNSRHCVWIVWQVAVVSSRFFILSPSLRVCLVHFKPSWHLPQLYLSRDFFFFFFAGWKNLFPLVCMYLFIYLCTQQLSRAKANHVWLDNRRRDFVNVFSLQKAVYLLNNIEPYSLLLRYAPALGCMHA